MIKKFLYNVKKFLNLIKKISSNEKFRGLHIELNIEKFNLF